MERFDVVVIGAGPGDPDLLTVKALRLLQAADVVLHDGLVPQAILALASPIAEVINVGKRCGAKCITQQEINALMIEHARANRSVVRLKSGDPLLFGRAAEEIAALTEACRDGRVAALAFFQARAGRPPAFLDTRASRNSCRDACPACRFRTPASVGTPDPGSSDHG